MAFKITFVHGALLALFLLSTTALVLAAVALHKHEVHDHGSGDLEAVEVLPPCQANTTLVQDLLQVYCYDMLKPLTFNDTGACLSYAIHKEIGNNDVDLGILGTLKGVEGFKIVDWGTSTSNTSQFDHSEAFSCPEGGGCCGGTIGGITETTKPLVGISSTVRICWGTPFSLGPFTTTSQTGGEEMALYNSNNPSSVTVQVTVVATMAAAVKVTDCTTGVIGLGGINFTAFQILAKSTGDKNAIGTLLTDAQGESSILAQFLNKTLSNMFKQTLPVGAQLTDFLCV